MRNVLAVTMAVCFLLYSVLPLNATPVGVQCPTAAVQAITVAVHDCCGKLAGFTTRSPKPGDKSFVQCHCAEKKSGVQKATVGTKTPPFLSVAAELPEISSLPVSDPAFDYCRRLRSLGFPPQVLPPVMRQASSRLLAALSPDMSSDHGSGACPAFTVEAFRIENNSFHLD